ncbi:MAG TPA: phosphodiester glycosidase family protein [Pyrinomonadaceae bacterium]|nr:phosphodiester glycosidase family protein [Pyrinomonadaceae bacterium]
MNPKATPQSLFSTRNARLLRPLFLTGLILLVLSAATGPIPFAQNQTASQTASSLKFETAAPGLEFAQATRGYSSSNVATGPWFINALRVDLDRATIKIVRALDAGLGLETVSSLAARHGATAAINGGYFRTTGTYRGESLGLVLLNGKLISEPHNDRAGVGLIDKGSSTEIVFGHLGYESELSFGTRKHKVHGVNRAISKNELIVFTPEFHRTTLTNADGIELVVRKNRVVSISDMTGSSEIPSDGFVVSAVGEARDWTKRNVRKGSLVRFRWRLRSLESQTDDTKWTRAQNILGAGPQLIKAGKIDITDKRERMIEGFATTRHPRTAIARLESGKLLLITVDGRQPGVSVGMSLQELAELLRELGAVDAINLDGGGSTTMVVHHTIVNRPSDQTGERPVSDAILVFSNRFGK